jgi:SARP family transcriptional regulator, regulator of embCAB operon
VVVAAEAFHRAEGAFAREEWATAWGPARVAQHIATRKFLPGDDCGWARGRRDALRQMLVSSLELAAAASLGVGGSELPTAECTARRLVELAPLRESGTRLLMEAVVRRGNPAEALVAYDRLRDELGVVPSAETQALHRALLG